jgi:hypothetical protein
MRTKLIRLALMLGLLAGVGVATSAEAYILCWAYHGTSCTTPGPGPRCYNRYPDEPGRCNCTTNHIYICG